MVSGRGILPGQLGAIGLFLKCGAMTTLIFVIFGCNKRVGKGLEIHDLREAWYIE